MKLRGDQLYICMYSIHDRAPPEAARDRMEKSSAAEGGARSQEKIERRRRRREIAEKAVSLAAKNATYPRFLEQMAVRGGVLQDEKNEMRNVWLPAVQGG